MRISDWSSDVCSSDLLPRRGRRQDLLRRQAQGSLSGDDAGRRKRADGRYREHELIVKAALFLIACVASSGCDSGAEPASSETAPAYPFPSPTGGVVDAAYLLPPQQAARLSEQLKTLDDRSYHQFVEVTVSSIGVHT